MKYLGLFLLILCCQTIGAQEVTLNRGAVTDSIRVNDSIAETYSLYLPADFSTERAWPVIFLFDPEGRGRTVTQLFRQVAEEQGYVIAASNDIHKDTALVENVKVASRLVHSVLGYLPVQSQQLFTAGLAEGAQVATVLPAVFGDVQGVMAVGDTWLNTDFIKKGAKFTFVGLAGYKDNRISVLEETASFLRSAGLEARTYNYEGEREWPTQDVVYNAVGTFTLEAMGKGHRPNDPALIETLYQAELETAENLRRRIQPYKAYQLLDEMEAKYALFDKKNDLRQRKKELSREKTYRAQRRQYNRAAYKESELQDQYIYFFNEDVYAANFENLGWWSQQIKELQEMQEGDNQAESEMAFRVEGLLQALAHNSFEDLKERNAAIDHLIFTAILQTIFDKENPEGYRNIISLSAQDGDYYTALLYLEDLLKTGYKDMEALYNIPGTLDLKLSPEYNDLVRKYLGEAKYYN